VHFVDDIDFEAALRRLVTDIFDDLADLIDAAVGRAIDFQNIDGFAAGDLLAVAALIARRRRWSLFTIQRFREDARGGGFAHSAYTGKKIRVGDTVGTNGILQRARDMALPRNISKILGTPLSRND
jgi:hypothetical protein